MLLGILLEQERAIAKYLLLIKVVMNIIVKRLELDSESGNAANSTLPEKPNKLISNISIILQSEL